jgi:uncharacterized membrane protein
MRVSQRWYRLMNDNHLWKVYAQRAHIIMPNGRGTGTSQERNFKALVRFHSVPSFTDLGPVQEQNHIRILPLGISGDGSIVVGEATGGCSGFMRAFKWTEAKGIEYLNTDTDALAQAEDISFDGSVIVGDCAAGEYGAWRWTSVDDGMKLVNMGKCSSCKWRWISNCWFTSS